MLLYYIKIDIKFYLYLDYLDIIKIDDINDFLCFWYFCVKVKSNYLFLFMNVVGVLFLS